MVGVWGKRKKWKKREGSGCIEVWGEYKRSNRDESLPVDALLYNVQQSRWVPRCAQSYLVSRPIEIQHLLQMWGFPSNRMDVWKNCLYSLLPTPARRSNYRAEPANQSISHSDSVPFFPWWAQTLAPLVMCLNIHLVRARKKKRKKEKTSNWKTVELFTRLDRTCVLMDHLCQRWWVGVILFILKLQNCAHLMHKKFSYDSLCRVYRACHLAPLHIPFSWQQWTGVAVLCSFVQKVLVIMKKSIFISLTTHTVQTNKHRWPGTQTDCGRKRTVNRENSRRSVPGGRRGAEHS